MTLFERFVFDRNYNVNLLLQGIIGTVILGIPIAILALINYLLS